MKEHNDTEYNQSLIYLLKRTSTQDREQILNILSGGNNKTSNLIAKFGDKEYSLLSALGSNSKISKINGL